MPFIYDETQIEWPEDDDDYEPPPPRADQFVYLSPPEFGGAPEPVGFSVAEPQQAAEPAPRKVNATRSVRPSGSGMASAAGVAQLVAATKDAFGGADILFNNAGTGSNETIMDAPDEKWQAYWSGRSRRECHFRRRTESLKTRRRKWRFFSASYNEDTYKY